MGLYQSRPKAREYSYRWLERHPAKKVLRSAMNSNRRAKKPFDIDLEWVEERLKHGRCEVTGIPFTFDRGTVSRRNPFQPSIDRIKPEVGYLKSNCRLVIWGYNIAKSTWTDEEVLTIARAIVSASSRPSLPAVP